MKRLSYQQQYDIINEVYKIYRTKLKEYNNVTYLGRKSDYDYHCHGLCYEFGMQLDRILPHSKNELSDYITVFKIEYAIRYSNGRDRLFWWPISFMENNTIGEDLIPRLHFLNWMRTELKYRMSHPVKSYIERLLKINRYKK